MGRCEMSPTVFRTLTVASLLLAMGGHFMSAITNPYVLPPLPPEPGHFIGFQILAAVNLVLGLVSTFGLLAFKRWARLLNILSTGLGLAIYPLVEYFVSSGFKTATDALSLLLGGAVLAAAYCSPLAQRFTRQ